MAPSYITAFFGVERGKEENDWSCQHKQQELAVAKKRIDSETRETGGKKSCKSLQDISDQTACFFV